MNLAYTPWLNSFPHHGVHRVNSEYSRTSRCNAEKQTVINYNPLVRIIGLSLQSRSSSREPLGLRAVCTPLSTFHVPDIRVDLLLTTRRSVKGHDDLG